MTPLAILVVAQAPLLNEVGWLEALGAPAAGVERGPDHLAGYILAWSLAMLAGALIFTALVRGQSWMPRWRLFSDLILPRDPRLKNLTLRYFVGVTNAVTGLVALNFGVSEGVIDPDGARYLTWTASAAMVCFYTCLRWERLANRLKDPSLGEAQIMVAMAFLAWGYVLGGPGRAVALMLLFIMLMFGMFSATPRQVVRASIFAIVAFGLAFVMVSRQEAAVAHSPELQMVHFGVLSIMLISACLLTTELSRLRARLHKRSRALAEALEHIKMLATHDELTGLFNRRHMLDLMNSERQRFERTQRGFCVCLIDVDYFKSVNDTHGHGVGDEVLRAVGQIVAEGLRDTDVVARWGGEEFLIMFTETQCDAAEAVVDRVRGALKQASVSHSLPELRVTFSAGLTAYQPSEALSLTIDRADQALYVAKAAGRNRTERLMPPSAAHAA